MGKSPINGPFSMAMLNNQMVEATSISKHPWLVFRGSATFGASTTLDVSTC